MIMFLIMHALVPAREPAVASEYQRESTRWFGSSVTAIEDLDKDGVPDFLVGEGAARSPDLGRVWAVSGKSLRALWCTSGVEQGDGFGASIAVVPDVNTDGVEDVVVGAKDSIVLLSGIDGRILKRVTSSEKGVGFGETVV